MTAVPAVIGCAPVLECITWVCTASIIGLPVAHTFGKCAAFWCWCWCIVPSLV